MALFQHNDPCDNKYIISGLVGLTLSFCTFIARISYEATLTLDEEERFYKDEAGLALTFILPFIAGTILAALYLNREKICPTTYPDITQSDSELLSVTGSENGYYGSIPQA